MEEELKVLILEDVELDAELTEYEMRREGLKFKSRRVETETDFIKELEDLKPDIILADHSLPTFDGVSALKIARSKAPRIPFIFVSGKIGHEYAVEMLKLGAKDYVFKNNLTKLVPAIQRALIEKDELEELIESRNELAKALKEKEMLLKEIHHRVKNNLMIISSLLELQSYYIKDKADLDFFRESRTRADSMAIIHERLYQSTDLKNIDFGDYISSLASELLDVYAVAPERIKLKIDAANILLDINIAIPLGLITNELMTNSIKHAFPGDRKGTITLRIYKDGDIFTFILKDDGIGFPSNVDYKNTDSLGLELVNSLTNQIDGKLELNNEKGTEFKITFKELEYKGSI
ncbi:MAG: response regulator [Methanobacterium sp.]|jgi:two-component sensor histidine kinase/CheY-like chemotaxis protein|nr:response regulator [Methanobacterium sp.]